MNIEIKLFSKELKQDYLFLFDNMIHKENPDWAKCYCNDYHFLGDVETCTRDMSRVMIIDRIDKNELRGYLVYSSGKVIGWCNVNSRSNYQRLLRDYNLMVKPEEKVCSVVCFLIHPDYRRQGLAQKILNKIIVDYSDSEYDYLESYPKKGETSTSNFNGPMELYLKNDFAVYKEYDKYFVMRKKLK